MKPTTTAAAAAAAAAAAKARLFREGATTISCPKNEVSQRNGTPKHSDCCRRLTQPHVHPPPPPPPPRPVQPTRSQPLESTELTVGTTFSGSCSSCRECACAAASGGCRRARRRRRWQDCSPSKTVAREGRARTSATWKTSLEVRFFHFSFFFAHRTDLIPIDLYDLWVTCALQGD